MNITYIVSLFPCWSEPFILSEIIELEQKGVDIRNILSLKPPYERLVHKQARPYLDRTKYPSNLFAIIVSNLYFLFNCFIVYSGLLGKILFSRKTRTETRIKNLTTFFIAVDFSRRINWKDIKQIHSHWATYPALAAMIISRLKNISYSFTAHAHDIFLNKELLTEKIREAKQVITISDFNKRYLRRLYKANLNGKLKVIRCGINTNDFNFDRLRQNELKIILSIGRLTEIKGFIYLIEAIEALRDEKYNDLNFLCKIAGEGEQRDNLANLIRKHQLGKFVKLLGAVTQDEVKALFKQADIFVMPSIVAKDGNRDGIPVVLMEAMASGVPVAATDVSGLPEIAIDNQTALTAPEKKSREMANAIKKLLDNSALSIELRKRAREHIEANYDISKNVDRLIKVFAEK